jgi:hypothetical protein
MKYLAILCGLALISGCAATHQLTFDAWRGLPDDAVPSLKEGILPFSKEEVFKAASNVLEFGPFLSWQYQQVDPKLGLIDAEADNSREVKISIVDAEGETANAKTKVSILAVQKPLKGEKDIWINDDDTLRVTAYDLDLSQHHSWHSVNSIFQLDQDYWVSAIYRNLTDKSEVPFDLVDLTTGKDLLDSQAPVTPSKSPTHRDDSK